VPLELFAAAECKSSGAAVIYGRLWRCLILVRLPLPLKQLCFHSEWDVHRFAPLHWSRLLPSLAAAAHRECRCSLWSKKPTLRESDNKTEFASSSYSHYPILLTWQPSPLFGFELVHYPASERRESYNNNSVRDPSLTARIIPLVLKLPI